MERDFNHPSIIGWCPFNETWDIDGRRQCDEMIASVYRATKAADPTRPCIDTSGSVHVMTDVYDIHDYEQDPNTLAEHYALLGEGRVADIPTAFSDLQSYDGKKPFFVSEYGGIAWTDDKSGWGYGNAPDSAREFTDRLEGLTNALLKNKYILRLLLHTAHRYRAGAERTLHIRQKAEIPVRGDKADHIRRGGDRGLTHGALGRRVSNFRFVRRIEKFRASPMCPPAAHVIFADSVKRRQIYGCAAVLRRPKLRLARSAACAVSAKMKIL